jgi:hypothetical protein
MWRKGDRVGWHFLNQSQAMQFNAVWMCLKNFFQTNLPSETADFACDNLEQSIFDDTFFVPYFSHL